MEGSEFIVSLYGQREHKVKCDKDLIVASYSPIQTEILDDILSNTIMNKSAYFMIQKECGMDKPNRYYRTSKQIFANILSSNFLTRFRLWSDRIHRA